METLWEVGLANALVVAAIAPLAALAGRIARRPAWAHALWVVVLLKLVTPPIAGIPIGATWKSAEPPREIEPEAVAPAIPPVADLLPIERPVSFTDVHPIEPLEPAPIESPAPTPPSGRWAELSWPRILGTAWLGGSAAWLVLAAWRIGRFARAMRRAGEAPEALAAWVESLSSRLGLARAPIVVVSPGRLAPMVYALGGRARLVVPEALWKRLDEEQRASLLIHELAHLKRRDHWVRLLELVATGLYWWHPALWWARKGLHRAEEECCDLWVVWALPGAKKTYATALVEAVEFLSETRPRRLPLGASGMGQVEDLTRRIGMIMRGDTPRGLSRAGLLAAIALALLLLPWRPTIAQQEPPTPDDDKPAAADVRNDGKPAADERKDVDSTLLKKELEKARLRLEWSKEMLKKGYLSRAKMLADEEAMVRARKRLKASDPAQGDDEPDAMKGEDVPADPNAASKEHADVSHLLRDRLKAARSQESRMKALQKAHAVSAQEVDQARMQVLELQEELTALEYRKHAEAQAHEQAVRQARNEIDVIRSQTQTRKAEVAKAKAQHALVLTTIARLDRLEKKGVGYVSKDEKEQAQAQLAIAEAQISVVQAEADESELKLKQATERADRLARDADRTNRATEPKPPARTSPDAIHFAPKTGARDADKRLDELESKLDRVLKEIEALRKEKGEGPVSRDESRRAISLAVNKVIGDAELSNEQVTRRIFTIFFNRKPTDPERQYAMGLLTAYRHRQTAVYGMVLRIAPNWFLAAQGPFLDQLAEDETVPLDEMARLIYRSLRSDASGREVQDFVSRTKQGGRSRHDAISGLVRELIENRGEAQPILEARQ